MFYVLGYFFFKKSQNEKAMHQITTHIREEELSFSF